MKRILQIVALVIFTMAFVSIAQAQATRTWVSGVGDDANPCSRTAPCKTFAGAISKTAAGGEIDALDPGGFGAITINKSITIDGTGTMASILASLTNGVIINAGASDSIFLRGISINGAGNGLNGIRFLAGKLLNVIDCFIERFTGNGIEVNLNTASLAGVYVTNTVVKNCGGDGISVSNANTTGGGVKATLERSAFMECGNGLHAKAGSRVVARNCDFSLNGSNGVFADATSSFATVRVWQSQISENSGNGVLAGNGGNLGSSGVEIAQCQINQNNGNGVLISTGGVAETFTNNSIRGNGTDGCPGCTGVGPGN